jgi:hypothetical protein
MKPINSRERSKQLWQFVFIFFALAFIPVALIFFSYCCVPGKISEVEEQKLADYNNFERVQIRLAKKMSEVDSNINVLADTKTEDLDLLRKKITDGIVDLGNMDSMRIVQLAADGYKHHFGHVKDLLKKEAELEDLRKRQAADKAIIESLKAAQANPMNMGYPPAQPQ